MKKYPAIPEKDCHQMREHRQSLHLNQPQYAKALGVSLATVKAIEYRRLEISPKMRARMMTLTRVDPADTKQLIEKLVSEYRAKLERELLSGRQFIKDGDSVHGVHVSPGSSGSACQIPYYGV